MAIDLATTSEDNASSIDAPGVELNVTDKPAAIDKGAIMAALNKLRGNAPDAKAEAKAVKRGEPIGAEPGALDADYGDPEDLDEAEDQAEAEASPPESAQAAPAAADESETEDTPLTAEQQVKLRVRQEAQRIRAKQQKALQEAEAERRAAVEEREAAKREREEAARAKSEDDARREKANKDPYAFLEELTGQKFDDLVVGKIEEGTPAAKMTALQKQNQALALAIKDINDRHQKEKDEIAEARKRDEEKALQTQEQQKAQESRDTFKKLAKDSAAKYPVAAMLAEKADYILVGMGYAAHFEFQKEHGRVGSQEELLATIEKAFTDEEGVAVVQARKAQGKKPGAVARGEAAPAPKPLADLSDEERKELALKEILRMRGKPVRQVGAR